MQRLLLTALLSISLIAGCTPNLVWVGPIKEEIVQWVFQAVAGSAGWVPGDPDTHDIPSLGFQPTVTGKVTVISQDGCVVKQETARVFIEHE